MFCGLLPLIESFVNKNDPIRKTTVPTENTTVIITVNASNPAILKCSGIGGSSGATGHDKSQSAQEQAGSSLYSKDYLLLIIFVRCNNIQLTLTALLQGTVFGFSGLIPLSVVFV